MPPSAMLTATCPTAADRRGMGTVHHKLANSTCEHFFQMGPRQYNAAAKKNQAERDDWRRNTARPHRDEVGDGACTDEYKTPSTRSRWRSRPRPTSPEQRVTSRTSCGGFGTADCIQIGDSICTSWTTSIKGSGHRGRNPQRCERGFCAPPVLWPTTSIAFA
jgi:hypothetical protein